MFVIELLAGWFGVSVVVGLVFGQVLRRADPSRRSHRPVTPALVPPPSGSLTPRHQPADDRRAKALGSGSGELHPAERNS